MILQTTYVMKLQCGCTVDEIGGILLAECKGHKQSYFRK